MPFKKKTGGKKHRRFGKAPVIVRKFIKVDKDKSQFYAKVIKRLGGKPANILVNYYDHRSDTWKEQVSVVKTKNGRKKVWINPEDWVLVQIRECDTFKNSKYDLIHKFDHKEIRKLERMGEVDCNMGREDEVGGNIVFGDEEDFKLEVQPQIIDFDQV
jgi:translation initiation factor IF-1